MPTGSQQTLEIVCAAGCDTILTEDSVSEALDTVCDSCYDDCLAYCESCDSSGLDDEAVWSSEQRRRLAQIFDVPYNLSMYNVEGTTVCQDCIYLCHSCESVYAYESSRDNCCPEEEDEPDLHYYSYHPPLRFWHLNDDGHTAARFHPLKFHLYMGIELEMEKVAPHARRLTERFNESWDDPMMFYWKHDGSLGYHGAELVTQPATLDAFMKLFPFEMLTEANELGARSFHYESCGFHIHVSRSAFAPSHLWKFIKLQTRSWRELSEFAGRHNTHWASWNSESMDDVSNNTKLYAKDNRRQMQRYTALNFHPIDTVELRYFKGNINPDAVKRNVQIVDAMYQFTRQLTFRDVFSGHLSWPSFKHYISLHPKYTEASHFIRQIGI